jgi:hypothetical protein
MKRFVHLGAAHLLLAVLVAVSLTSLADGQSKERKLGTCGPPPRKSPQRQTSAEGLPPLPLPATPLRRSEPKAEPMAPLMIAKLEYGIMQDWNTDPGDVDNLMRHCRYQLGLWYSQKNWSLNELVAQHKANKQCKIPILYMSGHEAFQFTEPQRTALKQYVLDGGTLLGDACCGREEFADSFRREVRTMFPDRSFDLLEVDHPIYHAYYRYTDGNVHYILWDGKVKKEFQGPPQLLGMNIGCRTAVILTPWDMSCGWDEHTHDHGKRILPADAIRLGINMISYVAAERQLGEVQAVTREIKAPVSRPRQQFTLAQLRHQGDWNPDPNSVYQWMRHIAIDSSLAVGFDLKYVDANEAQLAPYPFLYLTGHRDPRLSDKEVAALRQHLQAGGFLFINNCCGRSAFDQHVRALVGRLFPDQKLGKVAADHALFKSFFAITQSKDRQSGLARASELEGITIKDRLVLVYSKNDMVTALKQVSDPYGNGYDAESCRRLTMNLVAYALQK